MSVPADGVDQPEGWVEIVPERAVTGGRLRELWRYRELMLVLTGRDIRVRYKQTPDCRIAFGPRSRSCSCRSSCSRAPCWGEDAPQTHCATFVEPIWSTFSVALSSLGPGFWLNAPHYLLASLIAAASGARIVAGPQQFGPVSRFEATLLRWWLRTVVDAYRTRNPLDLELLGVPPAERDERLCWDEVYSNPRVYPGQTAATRDTGAILVNLRVEDFLSRKSFHAQDLENFARVLEHIHRAMGRRFVFFSVSGPSFSDEETAFRMLREHLPDAIPLELAPPFADEYELMRFANAEGHGCVSMSFHGCLLCAIAGLPTVAVTRGGYYDYKYAEFDRYGDGAPVPVLPLAEDPPMAADVVVERLRSFDSEGSRAQRERAARAAARFYDSVVGGLDAPATQ